MAENRCAPYDGDATVGVVGLTASTITWTMGYTISGIGEWVTPSRTHFP